ncbi:fatty acyl-AMP ligase [Kitasatospora sp. P5_F3]
MSGFDTFTDLVRARTAALADHDVHVFLQDTVDGARADRLTYGELDREARRIASLLQLQGAEGKPVLLLYSSTTEFLKAFVACLYAGAVAVPVPLPGGEGRGTRIDRTSAVIQDTGARLVLTETASAPDIALWLSRTGRRNVACLASDVPGLGDADAWRDRSGGPEDLAFLQYTSGSVSEPRGVMVSHRNLLANQSALQNVFRTSSEDRFGGWLPHFHDMGFIAHLLHPLFLGSMSVQMSPTSFVRRPARWLQAIDEYRVTAGGGPNFCYDLCLRRVTDQQIAELDLSHWRLALNGAEPVRADTLRAFAERFAPAGLRAEALYPCYGLAEATLVVSGGVPLTPFAELPVDAAALELDQVAEPVADQPTRTLVSSGQVLDYDLRIVEPVVGLELPEGAVGEIWLRGDSVAQGYWQRPAETAAVFGAGLENGERGFLRTGDLGFLHKGELYITGRSKEVIILNGRNIYPQDIEWATRGLSPALGGGVGAAFSVDIEREQLVVVHELRAARGGLPAGLDLRALVREIQTELSREFSIPVGNVLLVRPGAVRRTTSGKVQRNLMRKLFLDTELRGEAEVLDPAVRAKVRATDALLGEDLLEAEPAGQGRPW